MRLLVSLFACLFLTLAFGSQKTWIVIPELTEQKAFTLSPRFDFRGSYEGIALIVGTQEDFVAIREIYPSALLAGTWEQTKQYLIIERPEFDFSSMKEDSNWSFQTFQTISKLNIKILYSTPTKFFVETSPLGAKEYNEFNALTEFVLVKEDKVLPQNPKKIERINQLQKQFVKRDDITDLISQINAESLSSFDTYLSGERNDSTIHSRNSFSEEIVSVGEWLIDQFESYGFSAEFFEFQSTYGPNVIATLKGSVEPDTYVVIGAHYDSRATQGSSPTQRAPGANDDGSGTSILLEIARIISENKVQFKYSVIIGAWCGEEQGLVGSRAYAKHCRNSDMDISAMIQGDMLAYRKPGERAQCGFPDRYHTPALTTLLKDVVQNYVPNVDVCDTSACCSDHQSFYEQGYAATHFFERCGSIADNQYHQEGDLVQRTGFDLEQWVYNAQAMFASLLTLAEPI